MLIHDNVYLIKWLKILKNNKFQSNSIKGNTIKKPANQIVEPENMFIQNKEIIVKGEKTNKKHKKIPPTKTVTVKQSRLNKWKQKIYHSKHHSCSVCGEGLTELTCKNKKCLRVFHLSCVNKNKISKCESAVLRTQLNNKFYFNFILFFSRFYLSVSFLLGVQKTKSSGQM